MMWQAFGQSLSAAVGIAISPIPIVLVILMLVSARARTNGPAFLVGWLLGVAVVAGVAFLLADGADAATDADVSDGIDVAQLFIALLFFALAAKQWRGRPRPGEEPPQPKLFAAVDGMGAAKAFGLAFVACVANPKNLPLAATAGAGIAQVGATGGAAAGALVLFVLVASASVAAPVVVYFALGDRAPAILAEWKTWLIANNATVMMVLFGVLGAKALGTGLGVLG
jgi:threonine/homoserine/homoserine lactone efflux protein